MLNTLRNRLLASYVMILVILLILIGVILLAFVAARPLPTDDIVNDLTAILLDVRVGEVLMMGGGMSGNGVPGANFTVIEQRVVEFVVTEAEQRDVRALVVNGNGRVQFDSAGTLEDGAQIAPVNRTPVIPVDRSRINTVFKGRFKDPGGDEWIYVAQPIRPTVNVRADSAFLVISSPVPRRTLGEVVRVFRESFFMPLLQAGAIGLIIALALSVLISGSVARPLQQISRAARRIANGDYQQRVPVNGPREVQGLARSFNEMVERVAVTQQTQRDFLANVSHDLRTPLTSIQGFSQAIAEGVASDPESAQRAAQIIYDETARLHRMVESLLDLARIEAGQMDVHHHAVALSSLLSGIGERLQVKAREQGISLHLDVPEHLPRIAGDGDRLAQVFTNLVDNAIKHTPAGGTVSLHAETGDGNILIRVADTGEGIPPDDLPRIFERFYQVDKSRKSYRNSGMGLGLAITRQIVEAHGGTIQVASKLGEGTTFSVWLPLPTPDMTTINVRRSS